MANCSGAFIQSRRMVVPVNRKPFCCLIKSWLSLKKPTENLLACAKSVWPFVNHNENCSRGKNLARSVHRYSTRLFPRCLVYDSIRFWCGVDVLRPITMLVFKLRSFDDELCLSVTCLLEPYPKQINIQHSTAVHFLNFKSALCMIKRLFIR